MEKSVETSTGDPPVSREVEMSGNRDGSKGLASQENTGTPLFAAAPQLQIFGGTTAPPNTQEEEGAPPGTVTSTQTQRVEQVAAVSRRLAELGDGLVPERGRWTRAQAAREGRATASAGASRHASRHASPMKRVAI